MALLPFVCQVDAQTSIVHNPMLWADVPDPDIIRVDSDYYLVSTTMHLMPGGPIMHSRDFRHWETVSYLFDKLTDSPKYNMVGGTVYGRGQWATSLKYHDGKFYALFAPNDNPGGDTYIMSAQKASGPWTLVSRLPHFHDASLFFDDDGRVYVFYGAGNVIELNPDLKSVKAGGLNTTLFEREAEETGLLEGSRMIKKDGCYYLLMISWPKNKPRRQVCYRSPSLKGKWEKKTIVETEFGGFPYIGQGTIVDDVNGRWWGVIFQDRGGVGRVLTLLPCRWIDGWPILGDADGHVPEYVNTGLPVYPIGHDQSTVASDSFNEKVLKPEWQWNHNPVDSAWSLSERPGWLRLKTSKVVGSVFAAPNTLSQRLEGPATMASVRVDAGNLREGDCCGLAVWNDDAALLTISRTAAGLQLTRTNQSVRLTGKDKEISAVEVKMLDSIRLNQSEVWLRLEADFLPGVDSARLSYSLDGSNWHQLGPLFKMGYDYRRFFMGCRAALFCYATKQTGGFADFTDYSLGEE